MNPLDLIPFRTLLDYIVIPARRHVKKILLPVAVPLTLASVAVALAQVRWSEQMLNPNPEDMGVFFTEFFLVMGLSMVALFVFTLAWSALMVASTDAVFGREVRMGRAWAFIFQPYVFLTVLLVTFLNVLAFMMCFLPALYVTPLLSFVLPVMAEEGRVGMDAVNRSAELFRFNPTGQLIHSPWAQTLLLLVVGLAINYAVSLTVQMPFLISQQVLILRETFANPVEAAEQMTMVFWLQLPASVLSSLATSVTWLFTTFGLAFLYRELRRRKEAEDLVAAVDELTGGRRLGAGAPANP